MEVEDKVSVIENGLLANGGKPYFTSLLYMSDIDTTNARLGIPTYLISRSDKILYSGNYKRNVPLFIKKRVTILKYGTGTKFKCYIQKIQCSRKRLF
jgi:hypothetical protein